MKVRIKENSVRIRVTQSELARLMEGEPISERTYFPGDSVFVQTLIKSPTTTRIAASFDGYELLVSIPESIVSQWNSSDEPGIDTLLPNGKPGGLKVLIEKDFACLHRENEDADVFPNPKALVS